MNSHKRERSFNCGRPRLMLLPLLGYLDPNDR